MRNNKPGIRSINRLFSSLLCCIEAEIEDATVEIKHGRPRNSRASVVAGVGRVKNTRDKSEESGFDARQPQILTAERDYLMIPAS